MTELTITEVVQPEPSIKLRAGSLERPVAEDELDVPLVHISGWAIGRISPVVSIRVYHRGLLIRETPVGFARSDIAQLQPTGVEGDVIGFGVTLGALVLAEEFELSVYGILENGRAAPLGAVRGRHRPLRPVFEPKLQPIVVTTLGRSGGTWLMRMLGAHPQIVVYPSHPYESMPARYWMHLLQVLSQPADLVGEPLAPTNFVLSHSQTGPNPFVDWDVASDRVLGQWFARDYVESLAAFCQRSAEEWYETLARQLGLERPRCFAEKHQPDNVAFLTRQLYPEAKEVFLVRDLRDTVSSMLAFDRKRGYASFRMGMEETDEDFISRFGRVRGLADMLASSWRERSGSSKLVHYEDLVRRPEEALTVLLDYLELESSRTLVREIVRRASEEVDGLQEHRTSPDAEASIGRWSREPASFGLLCEESFGAVLEEFGYELAGATSGV